MAAKIRDVLSCKEASKAKAMNINSLRLCLFSFSG